MGRSSAELTAMLTSASGTRTFPALLESLERVFSGSRLYFFGGGDEHHSLKLSILNRRQICFKKKRIGDELVNYRS